MTHLKAAWRLAHPTPGSFPVSACASRAPASMNLLRDSSLCRLKNLATESNCCGRGKLLASGGRMVRKGSGCGNGEKNDCAGVRGDFCCNPCAELSAKRPSVSSSSSVSVRSRASPENQATRATRKNGTFLRSHLGALSWYFFSGEPADRPATRSLIPACEAYCDPWKCRENVLQKQRRC